MATGLFYFSELMLKMLSGRTGDISRVTYSPDKPVCAPYAEGETHLARTTPESQGVPSSFPAQMLKRLQEETACNMHRVLMARHGRIIMECGFGPFSQDLWHVTYSMCKSVTGMAIGFLISEGKLSLADKLSLFIEMPKPGFGILKIPKVLPTADITVDQLLTMTAGSSFNEAGAVSGDDWSLRYMEAPLGFKPGTKFEYNSMNSYMLSAIVTKITGQTMFEYLKPRLFDPLGIRRVHWETSPEGITKGGWALYMTIEDMAKLGILYLQKGRWNGRQILDPAWVETSLQEHVETGKPGAPYYGYQIWDNAVRQGAFAFNGMLGQDVFCYPDLDLVIVTQAGNDDVFQESPMAAIISETVTAADALTDTPLPENRDEYQKLTTLISSLSGSIKSRKIVSGGGWQSKCLISKKKRAPVGRSMVRVRNTATTADEFVKLALNGTRFTVQPATFGLMPLIMQLVHNNFTMGIHGIAFHLNAENKLVCEFCEGSEVFRIVCGFEEYPETASLDIHGEMYIVSAHAKVYFDEEDHLTLRLKIVFLEEAAARIITFVFDKDRYLRGLIRTLTPTAPDTLRMMFDETPGSGMMMTILKNMTLEAPSPGIFLTALDYTGATQRLTSMLTNVINPEMILTNVKMMKP